MKLNKSDERTHQYKTQVKNHWNDIYSRNIWRTVHQAGSEEANIKLAIHEIDVFLFPEEEKVKALMENKEINPIPTFGPYLAEHENITEYIPDLSEAVALDFGCGSLIRYTTALATKFKKVIGVDAAEKAIDYSAKFRKPNDNIEIILIDGVSLKEIESESVDFIFSNLVFQHIGNKEILVGIIQECQRVLRPGGVFRAGFWNEEKDVDHQSPQHGTGFRCPSGFEELFDFVGLKAETISWKTPVVWTTATKES